MNKLKIFISGTQKDMQAERDAVLRAIERTALATGIRAEQAVSRPQSARIWIEEEIKNCNVYVGVYGHRYGWVIPEENISATEFEFNLADRLKKPILIWVRKPQIDETNATDFARQEQFLKRTSDFTTGYLRQEFDDSNRLEEWVAQALSETFTAIIGRVTMSSVNDPASPNAMLVKAYVEEIARQRPYAEWDNETFINRDVSHTDDLYARTVSLYSPRTPQPKSPLADTDPALPSEALTIFEEETGKSEDKAVPLKEALERETKLMLLGEPGMGKTTSLLHLAWEAAKQNSLSQKNAEQATTEIPVHIELKYYNGESTIEEMLARKVNEILSARRLSLAADADSRVKVLGAWLREPDVRFLLLIDGLNEVRPEFHTNVRQILHEILRTPHRIVIACRERDYDQSFQESASAFVLKGLGRKEILGYLERVLGDQGRVVFFDRISDDDKMLTLAANPLILWLISKIATYQSNVSLPSNRGTLFQQFIKQMPALRRSESLNALTPLDAVTSMLTNLGFELQVREQITADLGEIRDWQISPPSRSLEDLLTQAKEWRFLKADGRMGEAIEFLHQLFLEYFAAVHLNLSLRKRQGYSAVLGKHAFDSRWEEVIVMLAGITDNPTELIQWLSAEAMSRKELRSAFLIKRCFETSSAATDPKARFALIDALIIAMSDWEDADRFWRAIDNLEEIGEPAVDKLIAALTNESYHTRWGAARVLGRIGDSRAVEPLIALLPRKDWAVQVVVEALANLRAERAVEPLINLLQHKNLDVDETVATITALRKLGDRRALESFISYLRHTDTEIQNAAAAGLVEIPDVRAIAPLIAILDDRRVYWNAKRALIRIGSPAVEPLIAVWSDHDQSLSLVISDVLRDIGEPAVEPLIKTLKNKNRITRWRAANTLRSMEDDRVIPPMIALLRDPDAAVSRRAEHALVRIGPGVVEHLIADLNHNDAIVRWRIITVLQRIGAPAVASLIDTLQHANPSMRWSAASALRGITDVRAIEPLTTALHNADSVVRRSVVEALMGIADHRAVKPLIAALQDQDGEVRLLAVQALGEIADQRAGWPLLQALKDPEAQVRCEAMIALRRVGVLVEQPFVGALTDEDSTVRACAEEILKGIRSMTGSI